MWSTIINFASVRCHYVLYTSVLCACNLGQWRLGVPGRGSAGWTGAWRPAAGSAGSATAGSCARTRLWASAMWWFWCCGPRSSTCPAGPLASPSCRGGQREGWGWLSTTPLLSIKCGWLYQNVAQRIVTALIYRRKKKQRQEKERKQKGGGRRRVGGRGKEE